MIKRYQSTWNIWSACTNKLCCQLKYFLFCLVLHYLQLDMICFSQALQYFPVIILRLQGWERVAAKVVTLIGMKKRWAGTDLAQGARLTLLSVMDLSSWAPLLRADWDALHTTRASTYLLPSQNMVVMSHEKNRNTPKHNLKHKALGQKLALWLTTCDM